jgi:hypothetical protein
LNNAEKRTLIRCLSRARDVTLRSQTRDDAAEVLRSEDSSFNWNSPRKMRRTAEDVARVNEKRERVARLIVVKTVEGS